MKPIIQNIIAVIVNLFLNHNYTLYNSDLLFIIYSYTNHFIIITQFKIYIYKYTFCRVYFPYYYKTNCMTY